MRTFIACVFLVGLLSFSASGQLSKIDSLKNISLQGKSIEEKIKIKLELSKLYSAVQLDSSLYYSTGAMKLSQEIEYPLGIGMSLFSLGQLALQNDNLDTARRFLTESLVYFNGCDCDDSLKAEVYFSMGRIYLLHDNYYEAQEYFIKGLQIAEKKKIKSLVFKLYYWMAIMYDSMKNTEDAEFYYLKLVESCDTTKYNSYTIFSLYDLGKFYKDKGELLKANSYILKAINMSKTIDACKILPLLYNETGNIQFYMGNLNQALIYYNMAEESILDIPYTEILQINYWSAFTMFYKGRCLYKKSDYKEALDLLKTVRNTAIKKDFYKLQADASEYLAMTYEKMGKYHTAIYYFKDFYNLHDSIISTYNVARVTKLEMEYRHMKELHKNHIKQLELDQQYQKQINNYKISIVGAILLLIILVLLFINYRNSQRAKTKHEKLKQEKLKTEKDYLQKELDFKSRELTTSVMYLLKKNNFLKSLNEKLKNAILPLKPEVKKPITDIIKETDKNIESDTWEEFETRFNNVHHDFSSRLLNEFPDLTPNELKLCAFLKLNMSTKEILTITHQSSNSISVARHRLRTKLGIERDENLTIFLSKY